MRTFAQKPKVAQQTTSTKSTTPSRAFWGLSRDGQAILHLQRTVGNHAMRRLLKADHEEREDGPPTGTSSRHAHDCSSVPSHAKVHPEIQPKLTVNNPEDIYEREADRVANQVLQQKSSEKEQTQNVEIQAKGASLGRNINQDLENQLNLSKGIGRQLSESARSFFEPRMRYDFSKVRVHTDSEAAQMNQELGARAFTHSQDIYFGAGQYNPESTAGKQLLAHELTHVMQQQPGPSYMHARGLSQMRAPAQIQRKLVLTGSSTNIARVVAVMNAGIDFRASVRVKPSGEVEIVWSDRQGPPTREQQIFTQRLETIVNESGTTTVGVTAGGVPIVGSYPLSQIDIADIEALGIGRPGWDARAALLHELVEQREKQLGTTAAQRGYGSTTTGAHGQGLAAELGMIGAILESDSGLVGATTNPDGTMNGTRTAVFRYPNGTRYRVVVTLSHNNITNVARTRLP